MNGVQTRLTLESNVIAREEVRKARLARRKRYKASVVNQFYADILEQGEMTTAQIVQAMDNRTEQLVKAGYFTPTLDGEHDVTDLGFERLINHLVKKIREEGIGCKK